MQTLTQQSQPKTTKTSNQLLYSKSAIARVLNISLPEIERYQFWKTGVWVKVVGQKPTIVSFKTLKQHFVDFRKNNIDSLIAHQDSQNQSHWQVYNSQSQSCYQLELHSDKITCNCDDYLTQQQLLPKACCKHCYKVLNQIGFSSLQDYLNQAKVA